MKFRKTRIVFSSLAAIACVLLMALWIRSYWRNECFTNTTSKGFMTGIGSDNGAAYVVGTDLNMLPAGNQLTGVTGWHFGSGEPTIRKHSFHWESTNGYFQVFIPYWFILLAMAALSYIPWFRWPKQFRLRSLFILTTLIALLLGWIMYFANS